MLRIYRSHICTFIHVQFNTLELKPAALNHFFGGFYKLRDYRREGFFPWIGDAQFPRMAVSEAPYRHVFRNY